jgi:hypothetical protein
MRRQLIHLLSGSLAIWLVLAVPAWLLAGDSALLDTVLACALCLVPMGVTLAWCQWAFGGSPEHQLLAVLGGTSVRLVVVVAGGIGMSRAFEALDRPAFLIWVVVFYLATLALEVVLVARQNTPLAGQLAVRPPQTQP